MAFGDDDIDDEILEASVLVQDVETPRSSRASFPPTPETRVSPSTRVKHVPRVYQPVYPASPTTIAGGVSPNGGSRSPNLNLSSLVRCPEKKPNAFTEDAHAVPIENTTTPRGIEVGETSAVPMATTYDPNARTGTTETRFAMEHETKTVSKPGTPTKTGAPKAQQKETAGARKTWQVASPPEQRKRTSSTHKRTPLCSKSTNPVEARRVELALRRRDASVNAPRTPGEVKAVITATASPKTKTKTKPSRQVPRDRAGETVATAPPRVVKADLQSGFPVFTRRVGDALRGTGATDFFVDQGDGTIASPDAPGKKKTLVKTSLCFVAVAENGRGGVYHAFKGSQSPYTQKPTHARYAWYKHFGFSGKGAVSSWGHNPKRKDITRAYEHAKTLRGNHTRPFPAVE